MPRFRVIAPLFLLLALPAPAHALPVELDAGMVLQGSVSYDCLGCAPGASFSGVATFVRSDGVVTRPATGTLTAEESCGSATGVAYGTLRIGGNDYGVWWTRATDVAVVTVSGPGGFEAHSGAATLLLDAPPGTCGIPVTATLTAPLASYTNCACYIGGNDG